jgi:ATP-dependent helicase Lhr and Lhr-like helicase
LLQATACFLLYQEGFIEPPEVVEQPFDVLLHQALSIVKGRNEIDARELVKLLHKNSAFEHISPKDIAEIIVHLLQTDLLEDMQGKVFLGMAGEKLANGRSFYTLFQTEDTFSVYFEGRLIGELAYSPQMREDDNVMLAAQIWCIELIDFEAKKIAVRRARAGDIPNFGGGVWTIHARIRQKMMDILYSPIDYDFLNAACKESLSSLQFDFNIYPIQAQSKDRPVLVQSESFILYTFSSSKINRTIHFLLEMADIKSKLNDFQSSIIVNDVDFAYFLKIWSQMPKLALGFDAELLKLVETRPSLLSFSKFGHLLPDVYKARLMSFYYFDFVGAMQFVQNTTWQMQSEDVNMKYEI